MSAENWRRNCLFCEFWLAEKFLKEHCIWKAQACNWVDLACIRKFSFWRPWGLIISESKARIQVWGERAVAMNCQRSRNDKWFFFDWKGLMEVETFKSNFAFAFVEFQPFFKEFLAWRRKNFHVTNPAFSKTTTFHVWTLLVSFFADCFLGSIVFHVILGYCKFVVKATA